VIQDEYDPVIDFSWYWFIGKAKLNLTFKETGRLTLTMFNKLYKHYKDMWDMEMLLTQTKTTHEQAYNKAQKDEEWF
jgi:hypothetical protein